jgi:hypothetical protein
VSRRAVPVAQRDRSGREACGTGRAGCPDSTGGTGCAGRTPRPLRASVALQRGNRFLGQVTLLQRPVDHLRGANTVLRKIGRSERPCCRVTASGCESSRSAQRSPRSSSTRASTGCLRSRRPDAAGDSPLLKGAEGGPRQIASRVYAGVKKPVTLPDSVKVPSGPVKVFRSAGSAQVTASSGAFSFAAVSVPL